MQPLKQTSPFWASRCLPMSNGLCFTLCYRLELTRGFVIVGLGEFTKKE